MIVEPDRLYTGNDGLVYVQATDVDNVKVFSTSGGLENTLPFSGPFPPGMSFRGAADISLRDGTYLDTSGASPYSLSRKNDAEASHHDLPQLFSGSLVDRDGTGPRRQIVLGLRRELQP